MHAVERLALVIHVQEVWGQIWTRRLGEITKLFVVFLCPSRKISRLY
jgi:hypothetical protein